VSDNKEKAFFRELGFLVAVEPKWSLEGVFPSRAVVGGRASRTTLSKPEVHKRKSAWFEHALSRYFV
jgi:hypothetical protein